MKSQPDYCLARKGDVKLFQKAVFRQPRMHDSDHRAVILSILRGRKGRLKSYQRQRQTFPLTLPPREDEDELTRLFGDLRETCAEEVRARRTYAGSDWISPGTVHVGSNIEAELAGGDVQEAFRHLKGWYGCNGDAGKALLSDNGVSDFQVDGFVCEEAVPWGPPPHQRPPSPHGNQQRRLIGW
jgi:hypothetical protein